MFTGIVEELGTVVARDGARLRLGASTVLDDVQMGASIAVNGCCLTVVAWGEDWWEADVSDETFSRTSLGSVVPGDRVNLERPVRLDDRLGGHLVQGHVDGVGVVVRAVPDLQVRMPAALLRYVVEKGSITVDGVSLTVVDVLFEHLAFDPRPHHYDGGRFQEADAAPTHRKCALLRRHRRHRDRRPAARSGCRLGPRRLGSQPQAIAVIAIAEIAGRDQRKENKNDSNSPHRQAASVWSQGSSVSPPGMARSKQRRLRANVPQAAEIRPLTWIVTACD